MRRSKTVPCLDIGGVVYVASPCDECSSEEAIEVAAPNTSVGFQWDSEKEDITCQALGVLEGVSAQRMYRGIMLLP
jgi:hypothetical protein